jgi:hypothetical protein
MYLGLCWQIFLNLVVHEETLKDVFKMSLVHHSSVSKIHFGSGVQSNS